jgi:hypothetical protein
MIVVFHDPGDSGAQVLGEWLRSLAAVDTRLVSSDVFADRNHWVYQSGNEGVRWRLSDSRGNTVFDTSSENFAGIINRISFSRIDAAFGFTEGDQEYAEKEIQAFQIAVLSAFPAVTINPAGTNGMRGILRSRIHWSYLLRQAGLRLSNNAVLPLTTWDESPFPQGTPLAVEQTTLQPSDQEFQTIVFKGRLYGDPLPAGLGESIKRLVTSCGGDLWGFRLQNDDSGFPIVKEISYAPDIRPGGELLAKDITEFFIRRKA